MITTHLTTHAERQAQRRGIAPSTIDLVLTHADRSHKLPGKTRALWLSRKGRDRLVWSGFPPGDVDRARGVRLIVDIYDDAIITVEHMLARRAWQ